MTTDIAVSNPGLPASVEAAQELAREYIAAAKSEATLKAYAADWADFMAWAEAVGFSFLPATPGTVAVYASTVAESLKTSTITRRLASISQAHQAAGHESPTSHPAVREVMKGIRRVKGAAQDAKAALVTEDIREMVETLPDNLKGARDRALLLLGFAGAFRRSELVGLDVADMEFVKEGVRVTIRRSKTDQEGEGRVVGIPFGSRIETCPVRSLEAWGEA